MNNFSTLLAMNDEEVMKMIALVFAFIVAIIAMFGGGAHAQFKRRLRLEEKLRSRREETYSEIAAYIAEGTITPEEGERLIRAMKDGDDAEALAHRLGKA